MEILRTAVRLAWRHFEVLLYIAMAPAVPGMVMQFVGAASGASDLSSLGDWVQTLGQIVAMGGLFVAAIDICLGGTPDLVRSYRRLWPVFWRFLSAAVVFLVAGAFCAWGIGVAVAMLILQAVSGFRHFDSLSVISTSVVGVVLLVPAVLALAVFARMVFLVPVVVVEWRSLLDTVRRSMALGRGYHLRNVMLIAPIPMAAMLLKFLVMPAAILLLLSVIALDLSALILFVFVSYALLPACVLVLALVYIDMRVRKEGVTAITLANEFYGVPD